MTPKRSAQAGFTLMEVLLVSLLLAFLGYTTFQTVRTTINTKEDVDQKTETLQTARSALALLERDIRLAFYVQAEDLGWYPRTPAELAKTGEAAAPKPTPLTFFQGKENSIFFSARSHQRKSSDVPENEQHAVKFEQQGNELLRFESSRLVSKEDFDNERNLRKLTLLSGMKSLKFSYYDGDKGDWVGSWDTEKPENKERLPRAVRLEMEFTPDVEVSIRRKVQDIKIATAIPIAESAFKKGGPYAQTPAQDPSQQQQQQTTQ